MSERMKRREFIALLGAAGAWPLAVRAQQPVMPVVGFLGATTAEAHAEQVAAFREGLNDTGHVEGQTVAIEYRWAHNQNERLSALAAELVRRRVAVITAIGPAVFAAKAATTTIPIVFYAAYDPVAFGLVASLARPGGNLTAATGLNVELLAKRLELAREVMPTASAMALLVNPTNPNAEQLIRDGREAAQNLGLQLHIVRANTERDIDVAFAAAAEQGASAVVIGTDTFFNNRSEQFAALTLRHALPTFYHYRAFATAGGLMSYGGRFADLYRLVGVYVGRILKGEAAADLPVQQATKIELIINLKTAKALKLEIPPLLLARADQVIE